jgi:hypothetical protein
MSSDKVSQVNYNDACSERTGSVRHALTFWLNIIRLGQHPKVTAQDVDVPLLVAVSQAKWAVTWTVVLAWLTILICDTNRIRNWFIPITGTNRADALSFFLFAVCGLIAIPIGYGFFRLYTLVTHVLTLNVFQTRGQRLRLLNLETKMLSLTVLICVCSICTHYLPTLGAILCILVAGAVLWLFAVGYNHIFHKKSFGGLALFIGGTIVTWFVLFIGALAISVMVAVLAFFAILILRSFTHS